MPVAAAVMIIGNRRFAPPLWAVFLFVAVLLAMLSLGRWQLQRADEKIALAHSAEVARAQAPVALDSIDDMEMAVRAHRRVAVSGRWDGTQQVLWDNRAHAGQAGFEVLAPLVLDNRRLILVNRGWVPLGAGRQHELLPNVELPEKVDQGRVSVTGLLSFPSKGFASGEALGQSGPWPRLLQYFDPDALGNAYGKSVVAAMLQPESLDAGYRLVPNWQPAASGPEKHYGYAFQWFAMAVALSIIFIVVNLSPADSTHSDIP